MGYTKLFKVLNNDVKLTSFISNISSGYLDVPFLMSETLKMLDDDNPMSSIITETNMKSLTIMLDMYFTDCWSVYINDIQFDKLIPYGKIEVYKIDASNGLRYATVNEVAQGIKGLIGEYIYPAGEEAYKNICLLYWTFTGKSYYFRQAGYKLEYDNNGKVATSFYSMIQMSAVDLKNMFTWVSLKDDFQKAIKKIEKMKKSKGYKYATFEKDEITEDITIKQLVYNIYSVFPRNSNNQEYRKALSLSIKAYKDKKMLSPLEVSTLRNIYESFALDKDKNKRIEDEHSDELKETCEFIVKNKYSGKIDPKHFAFTIIETLKKGNYTKCSPKQYSYIQDALNLVNRDATSIKNDPNNVVPITNKTEILTDSDIDASLELLSDAIGNGLFDEDDE